MDYLGQGRDAKENGDLESTKLGGALQQRFLHAFGNHSYSNVITGVCEKQDYSALSEESGIQLPVPFTKSTEASMPRNKSERKLKRRFIIITSVIVAFVLGCLISVTVYFVTKGYQTTITSPTVTTTIQPSTTTLNITSVTTPTDTTSLSPSLSWSSTGYQTTITSPTVTTTIQPSTTTLSITSFTTPTDTTSLSPSLSWSSSVQCPNNYTKYESETCGRFCYRYESNQCQSWFGARQTCQNEGSDLMVPSECSYPFFREQASLNEGSCSHFWIGGRTETPGYNYLTVKGDVIPQDSRFSYWSSGQPDGLGGESCLEMRSYFNNYLMNDYYCEVIEGFICQFFLK